MAKNSAIKSRKRRKRRLRSRPKMCRFCEDKVLYIDFFDTDTLHRYVTEKGRILPRRITGSCPRHQKMLSTAIKRARNLALI